DRASSMASPPTRMVTVSGDTPMTYGFSPAEHPAIQEPARMRARILPAVLQGLVEEEKRPTVFMPWLSAHRPAGLRPMSARRGRDFTAAGGPLTAVPADRSAWSSRRPHHGRT